MKTLAAVLTGLLLLTSTANARVFNFIYVEAGEGNSSGGHAAVQFGEQVFHFQYENGFLRLFKLKAPHFRRHYQLLQNRNLHLASIDVNDDTYERLLRRFKERFLEEKQNLKYLKALEQNQALLLSMLKSKGINPLDFPNNPDLSLRLPGAGLFFSDEIMLSAEKAGGACHTASSSAIVMLELRQTLAKRLGNFYLSGQISTLKNKLDTLSPLPENGESRDQYLFSEQYSDLLNELLALQVLQDARALATDACFEVNQPALALSGKQAQNALAYRQDLMASALSLVASKRPDKGHALLVSLARLIAIEQSIRLKHWVFVNDARETAETSLEKNQLSLYAEHIQRERGDDSKYLKETLDRLGLSSTDFNENYVAAEMAANRMYQWQLSEKRESLRYHSEQPVPTKSIALSRFVFSNLSLEQLQSAFTLQAKTLQKLMAEDSQRNLYHLLSNNCVSALFELINEAVAGQSEKLLGGVIDPAFNFIPFQAFDSVQSNYHVVKTEKLPSYREQKLAEMYGKEADALVYVREANIFSASLYRYNPDDAWFVFFTDDATVLRPLYGAVNTLSAASQSLVGLLTWPFDNGKHLKTGARGIVASLPELAFFNIRKGSYPYTLK